METQRGEAGRSGTGQQDDDGEKRVEFIGDKPEEGKRETFPDASAPGI